MTSKSTTEKQKLKRPIFVHLSSFSTDTYRGKCPLCGKEVATTGLRENICKHCGQKLGWR